MSVLPTGFGSDEFYTQRVGNGEFISTRAFPFSPNVGNTRLVRLNFCFRKIIIAGDYDFIGVKIMRTDLGCGGRGAGSRWIPIS